MNRFICIGILLALSGCTPVFGGPDIHTLSKFKGTILNSDESPFANSRVVLTLTRGTKVENQEITTDATGAFDLKSPIQDLGTVMSARMTAEDGHGARIDYDVSSLIRERQVGPTLRFLGLQVQDTKGDRRFSWKSPNSAAKSFLVELYKEDRPYWAQQSQGASVTLPGFLFEAGSNFQAKVKGLIGDSTAFESSTSEFKGTGDVGDRLSIQAVTGPKGIPMPNTFDGDVSTSAFIEVTPGEDTLGSWLIIDLGSVQAIDSLVLHGYKTDGDPINLFRGDDNKHPNGNEIATVYQQGDSIARLNGVKTRYLMARLHSSKKKALNCALSSQPEDECPSEFNLAEIQIFKASTAK